MKLLIDSGNSRLKWALLEAGQLKFTGQEIQTHLPRALQHLQAEYPAPETIWISNVAERAKVEQIRSFAEQHWQIDLNEVRVEVARYGIRNGYETYSQLGIDRWVAMVGAWHQVQGACCIVDCGTAVTIDVLDKQGQHQGGLIYPGLRTMTLSLSSNTHALPEVNEKPAELLAHNTRSGIATGCHRAVVACINHTIEAAIAQFGPMQCLITGGDATAIISELTTDMSHHPQMVLEGLAVYAEDAL